MITVTSIFDDKGRKIGEMAKCDHSQQRLFTWGRLVAGVFVALIAGTQIFA